MKNCIIELKMIAEVSTQQLNATAQRQNIPDTLKKHFIEMERGRFLLKYRTSIMTCNRARL